MESFAASFASYVLFFGFVELPIGLFGPTHKALWARILSNTRQAFPDDLPTTCEIRAGSQSGRRESIGTHHPDNGAGNR